MAFNREAAKQAGYSDEEIDAYLGKRKPVATAEQQEMVDIPSRVLKGALDPVDGLAQLVYNVLPSRVRKAGDRLNNYLADKGLPLERIPEGGLNQLISTQEQQYQQARQAVGQTGPDMARVAGNLGTTVPLAVAAPNIAASTMPARMAAGAVTGAAFGATNPVTENMENFWSEKGRQSSIGAVGGLIAAPIAGGIARMIQPKTDPAVQALMKEGITPTPGQILGHIPKVTEEKLRSVPLMGDLIASGQRRSLNELNRAAYNRALRPIGLSAKGLPVGREGVSAVREALEKAYGKVLPKVHFAADKQFLDDITNIKSMVATTPDDVANQFNKILSQHVVGKMTSSGRMSGETLKQIESEIGRLARGFRGDASFDKRQLGDALFEVQSAIRSALIRTNPTQAKALQNINKGYANYAVIRNAASRAGTEGGFSAAQLAQAVKAMDKSVGKGATATGRALMQDLSDNASKVLTNRYPDSGTAGRLLLDAAALGTGLHNPAIPMSLAAGGLPYTSFGQRLMAGLLTQRPENAALLANAVKNISPVAGGLLAPAISD